MTRSDGSSESALEAAAQLAALVKRRNGCKCCIIKIEAKVGLHVTNPLDLDDVEIMLGSLAELHEQFQSIQLEVFAYCEDDAETEVQAGISEKVDDTVRACKKALLKIQRDLTPTSSAPPSPTRSGTGQPWTPKLPSIDLPSFDGRYELWNNFEALFSATVDKHPKLDDTQKLHYLVTSMKGSAQELIRSYDIVPANYSVVWDVLKKRYSNEREKIHSILERLFRQPVVSKESAIELQKLADTTNECVLSLKNLKVPVDSWDCVLVYLLQDRLDRDSHREWCRRLKATEYPKYREIVDFLEDHIRGLRSLNPASSSRQTTSASGSSGSRGHTSSFLGVTDKCWLCNQPHPIVKCRKFRGLTVNERLDAVRAKSACYNCLERDHGSRSCPSKDKCRTCHKSHHSLLHFIKPTTAATSSSSGTQQQATATTLHAGVVEDTQVLLSTVLVKVKDSQGTEVICRGLLDGGSGATLISESCVKRLGLKRQRENLPLRGVGGIRVGSARGKVRLILSSIVGNGTVEVDAYILPRVTGALPALPCNTSSWSHVDSLRLADPNCHEPGPIDILLDADVTSKVELDGKVDGGQLTPRARNTIFGWVLSGRVKAAAQPQVPIHTVSCEVDSTLRRFWELEELPPKRHLTVDEKTVENQFVETHTRDEEGRYVVKLPFRVENPNFVGSRSKAVSRLRQLEKRLSKLPECRQQYLDFMREYQSLGHMKPIATESNVDSRYYLPHHFVQKLESTTTQLRVVFDGSAKDCEGKSLNSLLHVGPTIQDDLFTILTRFRTHEVALKADIGKMYRQFKVHDRDANFQCIVWRESSDLPIQDFRLTTLTYGTAAAAFLATRCLRQLTLDEEKDFPTAAPVLRRDSYVDDLVSGESSSERAMHLQQQLCELTRRGGMEIRKWTTSDPDVLASIPIELREKKETISLDTDCTVKALGVQWNPSTDSFGFSVVVPETTVITKRVLLSELAKVFDPLGWLSPTTICAKTLFQELWKLEFEWDQPLPHDIQQKWQDYRDELHHIRKLSIPRCIVLSGKVTNQFHGFSDASEKAYAAVVYLRCQRDDGYTTVRLYAAKTKVAPIRQVSLPRLELCGAVLLCHLMSSVRAATGLEGEVFAWSDSTTVLHWLKSHPGRWKTFVANRVAEVQGIIPGDCWSHVKGDENPADAPSRGISACELMDHALWWSGPSWLMTSAFPIWNQDPDLKIVECEEKKIAVQTHHMCVDEGLIFKYSDLNLLKRTTARCLRFIDNCRSKVTSAARRTGPLSVTELQNALHHHIRYVQELEFAAEFKSLRKSKSVPATSKLLQLSPFVDRMGLLRVGGRLQKSNLPEKLKHQIILPSNHHLSKLIINHYHHLNMHAGFQLLWATMQREYWILRSRDTIRFEIRKCVTCRRQRAETAKQLMGSLPSARVNPGRPFGHCGVDYAGPYSLRMIKGRGNGKSFKCYFAVFVCFAVKAIHLEAVTDLTSEAFIAAFRRFAARRGVSAHLYSDCGTNFCGADTELKELLESAQFNAEVSHFHADRGTTWHFNPPSAPHHGGIWEAGVRRVKFHLKRVVGSSSLTLEEFQTLLCQAEACLNSRPLCSLSTDPSDYDVLTPGHFLIGQPLTAIPEPDLTSLPVNRLSRWQHLQQITQHFWKRWSAEYVSSLQQRFKWKEKRADLQIGDLVIVKDDDLPPMKWKMGRITNVHPGVDNLVRVVTVKTSIGEYERPIVKLCPLLPAE